jgi:hypothetical protein
MLQPSTVTFDSPIAAHHRDVQTAPSASIDFHHPATFESRGTAVPFTTPRLAGARARRSNRPGTELVLPNPSGARGVCILEWPGVKEFCNPTVHDRVLAERIARLPRLKPASVRDAALQVALEGYAGREAAAAAKAAFDNDQARRHLSRFLMLAELIEQVEPSGHRPTRLAEWTPEFKLRATELLRRLAPAFGRPVAHLGTGLAIMGKAFAPIGVGRDQHAGRVPRLIAGLAGVQAEISNWLASAPGDDIEPLGLTITAMMKTAHDGSEVVLAETRRALADPKVLLRRWLIDPNEPIELASRCDWVLDGWEGVCLLWKTAVSEASRRAVLLEIAQLLPVLPREVTDWLPNDVRLETPDPSCRVTSRNDTWRRGSAALTLIHRNETLRAMSM